MTPGDILSTSELARGNAPIVKKCASGPNCLGEAWWQSGNASARRFIRDGCRCHRERTKLPISRSLTATAICGSELERCSSEKPLKMIAVQSLILLLTDTNRPLSRCLGQCLTSTRRGVNRVRLENVRNRNDAQHSEIRAASDRPLADRGSRARRSELQQFRYGRRPFSTEASSFQKSMAMPPASGYRPAARQRSATCPTQRSHLAAMRVPFGPPRKEEQD